MLTDRFYVALLIFFAILFVILWQADVYRQLGEQGINCTKQYDNCPLGSYCKEYNSSTTQCRPYFDVIYN